MKGPMSRFSAPLARSPVVLAAFLAVHACAWAQEAPAASAPVHGLVELKRQATARGTPEETTKTNLKVDFFPQQGIVALWRLELPFPDAKSTFAGSPFDPD